MSRKLLSSLLLTLATAFAAGAVTPNLEARADMQACDRWVDSVYNELTPRERVAQLIFPKFVPTRGEDSFNLLKSLVGINQVGGLLFSEGTLEQYVEMTNYAQSLAKVPLLMVFDGEWGLAMRIKDTPRFPRNMALGAINDPELMYLYGREVARECKAAGIHVNFAPVLDVNTNPKNPVIGDRSFGSDPEMAATLGTAYSLGLEDGGVQAVAKHFPGHGDTDSDSHKTLPTVDYTLEYLDTTHLIPFRRFIDAGLSGMMTAHLTMPELDPSLTPTSLSQPVTTGLLKDKMGFEGVVYTDALGMRGARVEGRNNAVMAIKAGADVLESSSSPVVDIEKIMEAADTGELSWEIIEERCKKILRYKYILEVAGNAFVELDGLTETLNSAEAEALNRILSQKAITLLWNRGKALPVGNLADNRIAAVQIGRKTAAPFLDICRNYAAVDTFAGVDDDNLQAITGSDVVICAVTDTDSLALAQWNRIASHPKIIASFFTDPYHIEKFLPEVDKTEALIVAYDNTPLLQEYAAQAIFGGCDVGGILPVTLPGIAEKGTGVKLEKTRLGFSSPLNEGLAASMTARMDSIVDNAIAAGAFPGAQLLVAKNGNVVVNKAYGNLTAGGEPVTTETLYDLASVSKTLGTLPVVMKCHSLGLFDIDDSAAEYITPLAETGKGDITIRELLFHETGMPPSLNMYRVMGAPGHDKYDDFLLRGDITSPVRTDLFDIEADSGIYVGKITLDTIMSDIYNAKRRDDKDYVYSCLNFCLLMDLNRRLTGIDQRALARDSVFGPLGAVTTCYRPAELFPKSRIAPTEIDSVMRRQLVHGYVHDELANFSGGVQGNAGLFSNALDLAKICQMWLNGGSYGDRQILSPETVELFTTTKSPNSRRGLGFDKPDTENPDNSPTCAEAGPSVYGHTGFTGTIFWVDPENDIIFIFLNNRVNPSRVNKAFATMNIRPALFSEVYKAMAREDTQLPTNLN